jgi:hypothetical protein
MSSMMVSSAVHELRAKDTEQSFLRARFNSARELAQSCYWFLLAGIILKCEQQ